MKVLRRSRRGLAATAATILALGMVASQAPSFADPLTTSPYTIDGTVPDAGIMPFGDPSGASSELGPMNASSTKLGVIHTALPPMLALTNPNAQVDLKNIWLDTAADSTGDIWLYLGWQRDSNRGSGVIMYEFQQGAKPAACDYSKIGTASEAELIAACNPFKNRQPGDFILVWDQQGGANTIGMRTWSYTDLDGNEAWDPATEPLTLSGTVDLTGRGDAEALYNKDKYYGEATVNLSDTIFPETPSSCFTVGNVIPGTVTGNSDTADYKDVVLANFADAVTISNCGSVKVSKVTVPAGGTGEFDYTLARDGGSALDYADPPNTERTGTLTGDGDSATELDLRAADDYTLAEDITAGAYNLGSIVCTLGEEDPVDVTKGATFPVAASEVTACVITNDLKQGSLNVTKVVKNDNGGTKAVTDFSFTATGQNSGKPIAFEADGTNSFTVDAGTYAVAEANLPISGYSTSYSDNCSAVVVPAGGSATCTITNDDVQPQLKVTKTVLNNNGGIKEVSDFPLYVGDTKVLSGATNSFDAGTYQLSETPQSGYTAGTWGGDCSADGTVTLSVGDATKECTITNDDRPGTLTVHKVVVNDNGGSLAVDDFSFQVNGGSAVPFEADGSNALTVDAGRYTVTEPAVAGYTETGNTCVDVVVGNGESKECTITNDDRPGTLTVHKVVVNDNGGTLAADDFSFQVNGGTTVPFEADGSNALTVDAGKYTVTEPAVAGYTQTGNTCVDVVVGNGESKECTITNDDAKKSPGGDTIQSWVIHDSLILTGLRPGAPDADDAEATFTLYSGATCAVADEVGAETVPVTGTLATTSDGVAVPSPGEYHWRITYSGDQYNNGFTTACAAEATFIEAVDSVHNLPFGP